MRDRYVLLGLARPRAPWFGDVARWANSAAIPAEFLKCVSVAELVARLSSGRPHSAVLVDASLPGVDRDLIDVARVAGVSVLVVGESAADWSALGASACLPAALDRASLLDALASHTAMVSGGELFARDDERALPVPALRALVVAVCGPGGTGASVTAMALAQVLAARPALVVLADLALHAEQAMLHDVRDVVPGVQELVEAHRSGRPDDDDVRALTFEVGSGGHRLLLGLRRSRHWATLRPRAFEAAFDSLCRAHDVVVCDVDADIEGDELSAPDVADRNLMARTVLAAADVVLVCGRPGTKGVHSLVRVVLDLADAEVAADRIVPVVVDAPRSPRARSEITAAVHALTSPATRTPCAPPVFVPSRHVDDAVRGGQPIPAPVGALVAVAVDAAVARAGRSEPVARVPVLVRPGALGL